MVYWAFEPYLTVLPARLGILAALVVVDFWLAGRWLERPLLGHRLSPKLGRKNQRLVARTTTQTKLASRATSFRRLLWQQWHHTIGMSATIGFAVIGFAVTLLLIVAGFHARIGGGVVVLVSTVGATLIGVCAFLADKQDQSYRFFVEHAVSPALVWLSRQCVGLATLVVFNAILFGVTLGIVALGTTLVNDAHKPGDETWSLRYWLTVVIPLYWTSQVLLFSAGQLCSMLFRGGLLAGFFGLVLSGLLVWWALTMFEFEASWLWSVAPVLVAMFLATWLRTPAWLLERNGWRPWLPVALTLGLPTIALLVAVPVYRVYQIPLKDPGFSVSEFSLPITAEQKATADMYRRALDLIQPLGKAAERDETKPKLWQPPRLTAEKIRWVQRNQESLDLAMEASARDGCVFEDYSGGIINSLGYYSLGGILSSLLVTKARILQSQGDLDGAFEYYRATIRFANHLRRRGWRYNWGDAVAVESGAYWYLPSWAAAEGQTPERVRSAIAELENLAHNARPMTDLVKAEYVQTWRILTADSDSLNDLPLGEQELRQLVLAQHLAPWELARARRLLNVITAESLHDISFAQRAQRNDIPFQFFSYESALDNHRHWMGSTWYLNHYYYYDQRWAIGTMQRAVVRRRATVVLMALAAWRQDHGTLPHTLKQLVGQYFDRLPLDPYITKPFGYRREGFPTPIHFAQPKFVAIPADWPLIWSVGSDQCQVVLTGTNEEGLDVFQVQGTRDGTLQWPSIHYSYGWVFPLPEFKQPREPDDK